MKKARAGKSARDFAEIIVSDILITILFLILFAGATVAIAEYDPWSFSPWLIFIPAIILILATLDLFFILVKYKSNGKEDIEYDKNSIQYFKNGTLIWEILKEEVEQIEYSTSFPLICYTIKIRCNEKKNYFKTRTMFTVCTLKKLGKKYGYPISKV